MKTNKTK